MRFLSLLIVLAGAPLAWAEPAAELSEPVGGWRYSGLLDRTENPRVAYPTPPIDRTRACEAPTVLTCQVPGSRWNAGLCTPATAYANRFAV